MKRHRLWQTCILICMTCLTCNVFAFSRQDIPPVFIGGYGGYDDLTGLITADVLVPVMMQNYSLIYAYGQGRYGYEHSEWANNTWTVSVGAGYRQIATINKYTSILGAYLFGDYSETATGHGVMELSPGIESLGTTWDFRINGYLPFGTTSWKTQGWADDFGNNNYVNYSGHDQYDAWFIYHQEVGPGADAEVGRNIIKIHKMPLKGFINGYYYHMSHNSDIMGLGVRATFKPCEYLKVSLQDSYDNNRHNVIMAGVELALYDLLNKNAGDDNGDLVSRLFDPIERNFEAIGSGNIIPTTGGPGLGKPDVIPYGPNGSASSSALMPLGPPGPQPDPFHGHHAPERTNVWFFNGSNSAPTGGDVGDVADGTYEHPFSGAGFTQGEVKYIYGNTLANNAYQNAYLYFTQGSYNAYSIVNGKYQQLQIYPGESLWGRMGNHKGFQKPATGNARPNFVGKLKLDSNTSINELVLQNNYTDSKFKVGIVLDGATNVSINDAVVGINGPGDAGYNVGVYMVNNSSLSISSSDIYGYGELKAGDTWTDGIGLQVEDGLSVSVTNGSIVSGVATSGRGIGLYLEPDQAGLAEVNTISGDGTAKFIGTGPYGGYGLFAGNGNSTKIGIINNSNFIGSTAGLSDHVTGDIHIGTIKNSTFTGNGSNGAGLEANGNTVSIDNIRGSSFTGGTSGLSAESPGQTDIDKITGSTFTGGKYGLSASSSGEVILGDVLNSTFNASAAGIELDSPGFIQVNGVMIDPNVPDHNAAKQAYNAFSKPGSNTFNTPAGKRICVFGVCY